MGVGRCIDAEETSFGTDSKGRFIALPPDFQMSGFLGIHVLPGVLLHLVTHEGSMQN